ncbi:MAG: phage holin family protein [Candidatus Binatia bacterium]|jgi:hypothetical protein
MAGDSPTVPKPSLISLARGIIEDAKQLAVHQFEFRKYQTLRQVARAKAVAIWMAIGIAFTGIGLLLLTFMAVYLLHTFLNLELWGSYGIIGLILLVFGVGCLYGSKTRE